MRRKEIRSLVLGNRRLQSGEGSKPVTTAPRGPPHEAQAAVCPPAPVWQQCSEALYNAHGCLWVSFTHRIMHQPSSYNLSKICIRFSAVELLYFCVGFSCASLLVFFFFNMTGTHQFLWNIAQGLGLLIWWFLGGEWERLKISHWRG